MTEEDPLPTVRRRLLRGYGPLLGAAALVAVVAAFLPSTPHPAASSAGQPIVPVVEGLSTVPDDEDTTTTTVDGTPTTVPGDAATTSAVAGAAAGPAGAQGRATASGPATPPTACAGRQIPNDPYSPPCVRWSGSNGGATYRGVTGDSITVAVRIDAFLGGLTDVLAKAAGAKDVKEDPAVVERTLDALAEYFNRHYQFYGRTLKLVKYRGKGKLIDESLGSGQEGAQLDGLKVADELGAFADISAITPVYADALSRRGVVNIGAPFVSKEWLNSRRPFAWSSLPDCSTVVTSISSYYAQKLAGRPAAFAGGSLAGQPRRVAIVAPDNESYQQCARAGLAQMQRAGVAGDVVANEKYALDLNQMPSAASALVPKLRASGATTVICECDPVLVTFLTSQARQQNFVPEWIETGIAFTDQDLVGQLFEPSEWAHAFGISFAGAPQPIRGSIAYAAYKTVRQDEPSITAELAYYQLQMLAIGVQMAGPNLTPSSFEAGMFAYPLSTGRAGTWKFGPGDYATSEDAREIWWNPAARSVQNGEKGAWIETDGRRYPIGQWPAGAPNVPIGR